MAKIDEKSTISLTLLIAIIALGLSVFTTCASGGADSDVKADIAVLKNDVKWIKKALGFKEEQ